MHVFILLFLSCLSVFGEVQRRDHIEVELVSEHTAIQAGVPFDVALRMKMDEHWHTYWREPGDSGLPTTIEWTLPAGFKAGEIQWPQPKKIAVGPLVNIGYEGEVFLITRITPPTQLEGKEVTLRANASWLVCEELCIPGDAELTLNLPISSTTEFSRWSSSFNEARKTLGMPPKEIASQANGSSTSNTPSLAWVLLLAFLGGVLLNLMPCVFPVLSIKIMGFVKQAGDDAKLIRTHGLVFALGVLLSFWVLAGVLLLLRAGGEQVGWAFHFQSPIFVGFITVLLFGFALNLAGVFEVGTSAVGLANHNKQQGLLGSLFQGVLATIVATPCTAPMVGTALGFALAQPAWVSFIVFTALALGLAAPYLLLSFYPAWLSRLPKPGAWMETFKQSMSFPLFASSAAGVWVYSTQMGNSGVLHLLMVLVVVALAGWIYGRWDQPHRSALSQWTARILALLLVVVSLSSLSLALAPEKKDAAKNLNWLPYSPELVEQLRAEGRIVYIDFTATWCATCQWNKWRVFGSEQVLKTFKANNIATVKGDYTHRDPVITQALERYGRAGVPLNVLYLPNQAEGKVLPELLTPEIVLESLVK